MIKNSSIYKITVFFLLLSIISIYFPPIESIDAAETTQNISYDFITTSGDYEYSGLLFSSKKELETTRISVNAPAGKIIKKLEWINKSTNNPIRSVKGFTAGSTSWAGKDSLSGTRLKVSSLDNTNYGGVYYWDRWSVTDAGHDFGQLWKASSTNGTIMDNKNCNGYVEKETIQGHQLPKYPGCTDNKLSLPINRTTAFLISEAGHTLEGTWIKHSAISTNDISSSNTKIDNTSRVPDVHGSTGTTDPSTLVGQIADVTSIDSIRMYYTQTFNNDTYNKYWANPGAKQVWYFAKFWVSFDSYTYMYKDKLLRATFADGTSGLEITGATCVPPSGTIQLTAKLTKVDGSTYNLQRHDKLTWRSSDSSVMTINASGVVTAVATTGQATITAHFKDTAQALDETADTSIQVGTGSSCGNTGGGDPGEPGSPPNTCGIQIGAARKGTITSHTVMDPVATGVIKADNRDSEKFDVLDGIPTSESLYVNVFGLNYLYKNQWANMSGEITYTVPVKKTYILTWTIPGEPSSGPDDPGTPDEPMEEEVPVVEQVTITRPYSYWQIDNLEVYKLAKTTVNNYALPGGSVNLTPTGYTPPVLTSDHSANVDDHVEPAPCEEVDLGTETVSGGSSRPALPTTDFTSAAESAVGQNQVKNDRVLFNGSTVMNDSWAQGTAPTPGIIPPAATIQRDVLYGRNYLISNTLLNKANTTSTGTINYDLIPGNINGGSNQSFPVNAINTVTVHTPVVNYSSVTDDQAHNQKTTPNPKRSAFILDRPFTVRIPTSGQHRNIQGYGDRDYAKYVRSKQVYFPFDVYSSDRSTFYPKDTWITIPTDQLDTEFFLPVWVDEGNYQVYFRTIAENAPSDFTTQPSANLDLAHHVATDIEPVEVIGRVYDFHITDIADYNWETVFRKQKGSAAPSGASYWTGLRDIDGGARGNSLPYTLPIAPGKHPAQGYKNAAVKTGYHFKFDLKTKGNMFGVQDGISITPSFYFVHPDGSGRQPVDLYYHSGNRKFIRIGSPQDTEKRYVVLNERLRNVPQGELQDNASYLYNRGGAPAGMSAAAYLRQYLEKTSKNKTWIGRLDWMLLPSEIRTLIGPKSGLPASVDTERANAAIQRWYGEYSLPADVYVVKKGTDLAAYGRTNRLDEKSSVFLKKGYIVVNFNIETIREGNTAKPHLQYIHGPLMNQWQLEGYSRTYNDPYGKRFSLMDGDVIFYHADQSSKGDFRSQVPH
ncbi:hypothetical protein PAEVO_56240 [Paenibacillus sp. GM2FR]|nr:hypothetical protein PAEVO_56240 [Paenibacillus sp. GM2FR]